MKSFSSRLQKRFILLLSISVGILTLIGSGGGGGADTDPKQPQIIDNPHFNGTYQVFYEYDANISNGISLSRVDILTGFEAGAGSAVEMILDNGSSAFKLPLTVIEQTAMLESRPLDLDGTIILDSVVLTDGNNLAASIISRNPADETDISIHTGGWQKSFQILDIHDFSGLWEGDHHAYDLAHIAEGFISTLLEMPVLIFNDETLSVFFKGRYWPLKIDSTHADLVDPPVASDEITLHTFRLFSDGNGFVFYYIFTHNENPSDPVVGAGSLLKQLEDAAGDLNADNQVDSKDIDIINLHIGGDASSCYDCDIDGNGMIEIFDARKLALMCTFENCSTDG